MADFTLSTLPEALVTIISGLGDEPNTDDGLSAQQLKSKFDEAPKNIRTFLNNTLISELQTKIRQMDVQIANALADIGTSRIARGAVTAVKLATDAVETAKIKNAAVTGDKIASGEVSRAKLANDALYSPLHKLAPGSTQAITLEHLGKTFFVYYSSSHATLDATFTLTQEASATMPDGAEIGFATFYGRNTNLTVSGIRVITEDGLINAVSEAKTFRLGKNTMIAIKKVETDPEQYGDIWLITGNVEVVT